MIRSIHFSICLTVFVALSGLASAQSVQSTRPLKINTIVTEQDLVMTEEKVPGAVEKFEQAVGLETRKTLYPGRPIMMGDLGPVTVIERNDLVEIFFANGGLFIKTDGRSLGRAALGQSIRVMNSDTRLIVTGTVISPGRVEVRK